MSVEPTESVIAAQSLEAENSSELHLNDRIHGLFAELCQLKWLVLILSCFLNIGMTYTMDFPGSLGCGSSYSIEAQFHEAGKEYNQRMNQSLYSVYSWPNTVLAIFGGILIDKYFGLRRSLFLFTSLVFFGTLLFGLGVRHVSYPVMVVGRVIYGLGGESLSVAQSTFLSRWFTRGSGMSFAFGLTLSVARLGSSFNFLFSPVVATSYGIYCAVSIGTVLCGVSVVSAFILYFLDRFAVRNGFIEPDLEDGAVIDEDATSSQDGGADAVNEMKFSDILHLSASFWYLCGVCLFSYNSMSPFVGIAKTFFQVKYSYSGTLSSQYVSAYQMSSAIASPFVGLLVDKVGRNTYMLIFVSAIFAVIHVLFICTSIPAIILMVVIGLSFSFLAAALWPAVPLVVPSYAVAFSFGIMTSLQNIGLAIFPMLAGSILDAHTEKKFSVGLEENSNDIESLPSLEGFQLTLLLFLASALLSLGFSMALLVRDLHHGRILSMSGAKRRSNRNIILSDADAEDDDDPDQRQSLLDNPHVSEDDINESVVVL